MFHRKVDPQRTYVISDTHRSHKNICRATSTWSANWRDYNSLEEMDCAIDKSMRTDGDILIHLGDTIFGDKTYLPTWVDYLRSIYKEIYLVYGNHDDFIRKDINYRNLFDGCYDYLEVVVGKRLICMSHFPFYSWREIKHGTYHLHGHEHGGLGEDYYKDRRALDMGWDVWNRPLSLAEIGEELEKKPIMRVGHH